MNGPLPLALKIAMTTEHQIASPWLSAPRTAWIHAAASGDAKDCLLFLDGELFINHVKAPEIMRSCLSGV